MRSSSDKANAPAPAAKYLVSILFPVVSVFLGEIAVRALCVACHALLPLSFAHGAFAARETHASAHALYWTHAKAATAVAGPSQTPPNKARRPLARQRTVTSKLGHLHIQTAEATIQPPGGTPVSSQLGALKCPASWGRVNIRPAGAPQYLANWRPLNIQPTGGT